MLLIGGGGGEEMLWTKRAILASLVVGVLGAAIGGFLASITATIPYGDPLDYGRVPLGAVPGFLSCFLVSVWYLKFMKDRRWQEGVGFGTLFGALAGVIAGFIAIFGVDLATGGSVGGGSSGLGTRLLASFFFGGIVGVMVGCVVGFLSALLLRRWLINYLTGCR